MTYSGDIFKKLRIQKGFSTKEISEGLVTPQFINKYERGDSDIRFANLTQLLTRMHITMSEFAYEDDSSLEAWLSAVETDLDELLNTRNNLGMKKFIEYNMEQYELTGEERFLFVSLIMKNFQSRMISLNQSVDTTPISNYLKEVTYWGKFEFFLLTNCRHIFDSVDTYNYAKSLLTIEETYSQVDMQRYDTVLQLVMQLLLDFKLDEAKELLDSYLNYPNPNRRLYFLHQDLFAKYLLGMYKILSGDTSGIQQMEQIIDVFETVVNYPGYANSLHALMNRTIYLRTEMENKEL